MASEKHSAFLPIKMYVEPTKWVMSPSRYKKLKKEGKIKLKSFPFMGYVEVYGPKKNVIKIIPRKHLRRVLGILDITQKKTFIMELIPRKKQPENNWRKHKCK